MALTTSVGISVVNERGFRTPSAGCVVKETGVESGTGCCFLERASATALFLPGLYFTVKEN